MASHTSKYATSQCNRDLTCVTLPWNRPDGSALELLRSLSTAVCPKDWIFPAFNGRQGTRDAEGKASTPLRPIPSGSPRLPDCWHTICSHPVNRLPDSMIALLPRPVALPTQSVRIF